MGDEEENLSTTFKLRCSPEQKATWERAAKSADRSLSNWMRHNLDRLAATELEPAKGGKRRG